MRGAGGPVSVSLSLSKAKRPERRFYSAWPLAERAEALLRVFNDPAPYARRLAARLYATPHRARLMLAYPAETVALIGEDDFWVSYNAALTSAGGFDTS